MNNRIVVFGGTGFIGRNLCYSLVKDGYKVKSFDNNERGHNYSTHESDIEYIKGDICDFEDVRKAIKNSDIVFNLAFINGTKNFYKIPGRILEIAAIGQLNIGKAINQIGVEKFIYASSSETYQKPKLLPTNEKEELKIPDPHNPRYSYGGGKIFGELCTLHHIQNVECRLIFRPHNVYGAYMGEDHVIPELFSKIKKAIITNEKYLDVIGKPTNSRSFIYIDDAVKAIKLVMNNGCNREIFNIGSGVETRIDDLVAKMISVTNSNLKARFNLSGHDGSVSRRIPDISKIVEIGYVNNVGLDKGLEFCWKSMENSNEL